MNPFQNYRIIDLTRTLSPDQEGVAFEQSRTVEKDGWNARTLHLYSHTGTHMDAPLHFGVSEQSIEEFAPPRLMGKTWIARLGEVKSQQLLMPSDLGKIADMIKPGENLILQTGWSKKESYQTYRDELPRISKELAHWIVEKGINILGVEPPSVADVNNLEEVTEIHHILMKGDVIIVEGLVNLDEIQSEMVYLIALPLKLDKGDGSPIRAIALEPKIESK
ncbi:MAG: cyclase family protein [Bacteroidota bacterium]